MQFCFLCLDGRGQTIEVLGTKDAADRHPEIDHPGILGCLVRLDRPTYPPCNEPATPSCLIDSTGDFCRAKYLQAPPLLQ